MNPKIMIKFNSNAAKLKLCKPWELKLCIIKYKVKEFQSSAVAIHVFEYEYKDR